MNKYTESTVKIPGWYWFRPERENYHPRRFVKLDEDAFDDDNKWLKGKSSCGHYYGPIDIDLIESSPEPDNH